MSGVAMNQSSEDHIYLKVATDKILCCLFLELAIAQNHIRA